MTGGCPCGAMRYEIASFPLLLYTCNCTGCQRQSGSAFAMNIPVAATVRAGTLDDTAWLLPVAHIFVRSAQPWACCRQCRMPRERTKGFQAADASVAGDLAGIFSAKIVPSLRNRLMARRFSP
jgi:hypothetical protein